MKHKHCEVGDILPTDEQHHIQIAYIYKNGNILGVDIDTELPSYFSNKGLNREPKPVGNLLFPLTLDNCDLVVIEGQKVPKKWIGIPLPVRKIMEADRDVLAYIEISLPWSPEPICFYKQKTGFSGNDTSLNYRVRPIRIQSIVIESNGSILSFDTPIHKPNHNNVPQGMPHE